MAICFQSMHWALKNKKEPMLEASNAGSVPLQAEDLHSDQEAQRISSCDAIPSTSKWFFEYSQRKEKYQFATKVQTFTSVEETIRILNSWFSLFCGRY